MMGVAEKWPQSQDKDGTNHLATHQIYDKLGGQLWTPIHGFYFCVMLMTIN